MFTYPDPPASSEGSPEVGPAPYFHRSDCNICRQQDGLKTGSDLLDGPRPKGPIVESERYVVEHAPLKSSSVGTVIVQARRHLLDFGDMAGRNCRLRSACPSARSGGQGCHRSRAGLLPGIDGASGPLPSLARAEEGRRRASGSGLHGAAAHRTASLSDAEVMSKKDPS
jgi:hypothetical protein